MLVILVGEALCVRARRKGARGGPWADIMRQRPATHRGSMMKRPANKAAGYFKTIRNHFQSIGIHLPSHGSRVSQRQVLSTQYGVHSAPKYGVRRDA